MLGSPTPGRAPPGIDDIRGPGLAGPEVDDPGSGGSGLFRVPSGGARRMHVAQRGVHDGAVADAPEQVALGEQLVVRGHDRPPAHTEALSEGSSCWYGLAGSDEAVPDRRAELVGELAGQGTRVCTVDGQRQRDVARSPHRVAVPGARFIMFSE
jgi:hypothetical protein